MKIETLNRGEAQKAMDDWINNYPDLPGIKSDYEALRENIQNLNKQVRQEVMKNPGIKRPDYYIDAHLGLALYEYLWTIPEFSMRVAANDGFWRYLSVMVVPDVVAQRWGKDNHAHFWSQPRRVWLRSIWWYVHLAWQDDLELTKKVLECSHFTTDTILNFEERSGRKGTCVDAYRWIIYYYSRVDEKDLKRYSRGKAGNSDDLFRVVMKLNTAKMMVMEPALCLGGEKAYAQELYKDVGVDFNAS